MKRWPGRKNYYMKSLDRTEIRYIVMGVWGVTTEKNTELIAARVPTGPKIENPRHGAKIGRPTHILVCQRVMADF